MVRIITDSTSDITAQQANALGVTIVALNVIIDGISFREGLEITPDQFYEMQPRAKALPTTSQPAPEDFLTHFLAAKKAGDSVLVLTISSRLSGTIQSATIAKQIAEYQDIHVLDTLETIIGLRLLVERAVKLRDQGQSAQQIYDTLDQLKHRVRLVAMVDTLEYLHKGGRLSAASAIVGTILKVKPLITLANGEISVAGKARGKGAAIEMLLQKIDETNGIDSDAPVYFGYTHISSNGERFRARAVEKYGLTNEQMHPVGCVIGAHVGPGAIVVVFLEKEA